MAGLFSGSSERAMVAGCFRGEAPSLMFDGILNATLSDEEVSTTRVSSPCLQILNSHQTQNNKMISQTEPTSSIP